MKKQGKMDLKSFIYMNLGLFILSMGLHFFLIPANLAVGGVTGFSIVVNSLFPKLSVGLLMLIANAVLLVVAFMFLGREFGGWTVYNSILLSGVIALMERVIPVEQAMVENTMLMLIYGIVIQAVGLAIVFNQGVSTGGTDIIAAIINKFIEIDIGKSLFMADFLIAISAASVFGIELGMFALLGAVMNSIVIDHVIAGFNTKMKMVIVTDMTDEVVDFITKDMNRGATILHGEGGYSRQPKRIIQTLVSRREYIMIKNRLREMDSTAFIWVNVINEVLGEGFSQ